jgi:poly-gamma-glutamate capsule biosynthesis protein CapA/YwtB (metallophosphatase superfamily)
VSASIRLFLAGDVMTGRGIDQILRHPGDPALHEDYVQSALDYVALAEQRSGRIARAVDDAYIWGDALEELACSRPDARIVNLETAITQSDDWQPKGINYRMHPANAGCLRAAGIDCALLANNHVLDWGEDGLRETLQSLAAAGIRAAGAGPDRTAAAAPAVLPLAGARRVLVFAVATASSGVPPEWAAGATTPGVNRLAELSQRAVDEVAGHVAALKQPGDVALVSIHWGGNWGYSIPQAHIDFAHALIDNAGVDLVHGHSSHHPMAVDVHRGKLVLYGCGDFINDYEGINGLESYRSELGLMYLPELDAGNGRLRRLGIVAFERRRLRLERASAADTRWLCALFDREGERFGTRTHLGGANRFELDWDEPEPAG